MWIAGEDVSGDKNILKFGFGHESLGPGFLWFDFISVRDKKFVVEMLDGNFESIKLTSNTKIQSYKHYSVTVTLYISSHKHKLPFTSTSKQCEY